MLTILRDTREQLELPFAGIEGVDRVEDIALLYGDYTALIDGKQVPIFFERKGLGDLWGTMNGEYPRFKKEMQRATSFGHKLILITEGTYSDIEAGYSFSEVTGPTMLKKLAMLEVKYDLQWIACESREVMAKKIVDIFLAVARFWKKEEKGGSHANRGQSSSVSSYGDPGLKEG